MLVKFICMLTSSFVSSFVRWIMIYPAYVNSKKTIQEGRRITKSKVSFLHIICDGRHSIVYYYIQAADNPTCAEMRDVCASQGLKVEVEVCYNLYNQEVTNDSEISYAFQLRNHCKYLEI